ncbi:MAG: DUF2521 family protein [Ectobacillus sp.]
MTVITTLKEKRKEKQIKYERKMLRELSLQILKKNINKYFMAYTEIPQFARCCEEYCIELAIESYLLGASYSKFGYYGESFFDVKQRCIWEEQSLTEMLFHFLSSIPIAELSEQQRNQLYDRCQSFVSLWWKEGYEKGERRYRLRLH